MVDDLITQIANGGSFDQVAAIRAIARKLLALGGAETFFFYLHCWVYRRLS